MAKYGSGDCAFLLVDGYSLLGVTTELNHNTVARIEDVTPLGVNYPEQNYSGMKDATFDQKGFFDDETGLSHEALNGTEGTERVLMFGVEGNVIGRGFTGFQGAMQSTYERLTGTMVVHKANASYLGSGAVDEGVILHELSAETADGDTEADGYDGTAQSTDGGAAYLEVTALDLDGYDDITVTILDSDDDITYAALVAMTAVTVAPDAERKVVAGTVERYLACSWEFTGTGTSPSATFVAGLARA